MWRRLIVLLALAASVRAHAGSPAVHLVLDTSEAERALAILDARASGQSPTTQDWVALFATAPYQWLKAREAAIGRPFTDEAFKTFLTSPEALAQRETWKRTLAAMKAADMPSLGQQATDWLPPGAKVEAKVFPLIKPKKNSFVWHRPGEPPAIALYIEEQSIDKFANTVVHECHHIGLDSLASRQDAVQAGLPERVKLAMKWMSAFGEGEAMLAAAGSVDRHPHWEDDALARARWDGDMMHFNTDLPKIEALFQDILDGRLKTDTEIQERAAPFWGDAQGAWYTVGYEMAVLVMKHDGKAGLDASLLDPRQLLSRYDTVASEANAKGATIARWTPGLLEKLSVRSPASDVDDGRIPPKAR